MGASSALLFVSPAGGEGGETETAAYTTINAAIAAAAANPATPPAVSIHVFPGRYRERVVVPASLARALTVEAAPGASPMDVVVEHRTTAPYEATFEAAPGCIGVTLRNLTVRHSSPSVANNQAVYATEGSELTLEVWQKYNTALEGASYNNTRWLLCVYAAVASPVSTSFQRVYRIDAEVVTLVFLYFCCVLSSFAWRLCVFSTRRGDWDTPWRDATSAARREAAWWGRGRTCA